jgi:hypothetical protein
VEIGRNDFEGADLSRRLCTAQHQNQASSARLRWVQCLDNLQAPGTRACASSCGEAGLLFDFASVGVQVVEEAEAEAEVGAGEFSGECFEWALDAAVSGAFECNVTR